MKINLHYLIIFLLGICNAFDFELMNNSVIISGENFYSENPFTGGVNKPKIQWVDWNNDSLIDLFILDEDKKLKYFQNEGTENNPQFNLIQTSFQSLNCEGWFYFADFDNDNELELITQSTQNSLLLSYYENNDGILENLTTAIISENGIMVMSESVVTPTFADIDADGDLDFFTGSVMGTVSYFENIGLNNNIPYFEFQTNDWHDILIIGQSQMNNRHGANTINFIDLDGDMDLDLTWGDSYNQSLYVIWNIGTSEIPIMDNINITNQFPPQPYSIETSGQNMASFADIDTDGDMDLFISVLGGNFGIQNNNNFYHFENVGNNNNPLFVEMEKNYLNMLDFEDKTSPEFVDLDGDGDDDLIIGNSFETTSFPWNARLKYLENIGSQESPEYEIIDNAFLGSLIGKDLTPTFIDIDDDGDLDFFSGETYGGILFSENSGNQFSFEFSNIVAFEEIDVGYNSVPEFVDIDNDNDFDLIIGNSNGNLFFYENIGNSLNYDFILISENYLDINIQSYSAPDFFDIDNDSDFDLIIGSGDSGLHFFENSGSINAPLFIEIENFLDLGTNLKPALKQSSYGIIDAYVGNTLGGIFHLQFSSCGSGDLNFDLLVDINDIVLIIDIILGNELNEISMCNADITSDELVNINDILQLLLLILN
jgi:large repetitive protein